MIDPTRSELPRSLEALSDSCPESRFGQMIAVLVMLAGEDAEDAIWEMEDEELLAAARKHLADWSERHAPVP